MNCNVSGELDNKTAVWIYVVISMLFVIDLLSTHWLYTNALTWNELNPIIAGTLDSWYMHCVVKAMLLGVVLAGLCYLKNQSPRAFRVAAIFTGGVFGAVCIYNLYLIGVTI